MNKKIVCIFIIYILVFCFETAVYGSAFNFEALDPDELQKKYSYDINSGDAITTIEDAGASLITIVQTVSIGVSVLMLVVTGIRYILTATSDKKAELKKGMGNYIIGVIITFSAAFLLELVQKFISSNINP